MSEAKHTPGHLTLMPHGRIVGGPFHRYTNGEAQDQLASVMPPTDGVDPVAERDANAARLVACWNACQHVSTELLEEFPAPFGELRARHDQMLKALQGLLAVVNVRIDDPRTEQFDAARAAIAKATGGAP